MAKKKIELETFSMVFGLQTFLCKELLTIKIGHYSVLMKLQVFMMFGVKNLTNSTLNMRRMAEEEKL